MVKENAIFRVKQLRLGIRDDLNYLANVVQDFGGSRELSLARTKLEESSMWLGMELGRIADGKTCYPHSMDTAKAIADEPQAESPCRIDSVGREDNAPDG